jgi:hypothetical protein
VISVSAISRMMAGRISFNMTILLSSSFVIARSVATKQSSLSLWLWIASLRSQ